MYTREQKSYKDTIPDNYSGIAMGASPYSRDEKCERIPRCEKDRGPMRNDCPPPEDRCPQKDDGVCPPPRDDGCYSPEKDEYCPPPPPHSDNCAPQRCDDGCDGKKGASGIFSSLLHRLGFDGVDSTELIILFAALLLMSGDGKDDDSYIWLLLLFLLIR